MNVKFLTLFFVTGSLWACTPVVDSRGNLPDPVQVAQIKVGQTSQDEVMALIGSPSSVMNYGGETWIYVYEKIQTVSFFDPRVLDYKSLAIAFDDNGKVKDIRKTSKKDLKDVEQVSRETPTAGREYSFIEQMIGNVGKFTKDRSGK